MGTLSGFCGGSGPYRTDNLSGCNQVAGQHRGSGLKIGVSGFLAVIVGNDYSGAHQKIILY